MKQILEGEAADAVRSYQDEGLGKRSPLLWPLYYSLDLAKEVTNNNKGIICVCGGGSTYGTPLVVMDESKSTKT